MGVLESLQIVLVHGILSGAVYSLLAIGLSLVFGVAKIIDFTYVGYIAISSYILYTLNFTFSFGIVINIILSILIVIPIALFVERFLIRPFIGSDTQVMMITFAMALFIQNLIIVIWGPLMKAIPSFLKGSITVLNSVVSLQRLLQLPVAIISSISLLLFMKYTKLGKAIVAVSQDSDAAWLLGINVNTIRMLTIVLAACLAATASVISASLSGIMPGMGFNTFTTAFIVVIFGGMGSIKGSLIAAYAYAIIQNFISVFISPQWIDVFGFTFLIAILIARPIGVFGESVST